MHARAILVAHPRSVLCEIATSAAAGEKAEAVFAAMQDDKSGPAREADGHVHGVGEGDGEGAANQAPVRRSLAEQRARLWPFKPRPLEGHALDSESE